MTEAEYLARLQERTQEWRTKYPARSDELRSFARRQLGIPVRSDFKFATQAIEQLEAEVLRITQGWPAMEKCVDDPLAQAKRALDLEEYPETGRDRAAGRDE